MVRLMEFSLLFLAVSSNIVSNLILIKLFDINFFKNYQHQYNSIQKIHVDVTPRIGGLSVLFSLILMCIYSNGLFNLLLRNIYFLLPVIIFSLKEDIFHNTAPLTRMMVILITSSLMVTFIAHELPTLDIIYINDLFVKYPILSIIFFILCLSTFANSINLIDGANGLMLFSTITICINYIFLSNSLGDTIFINYWILLSVILMSQLFFNYPFPRVFIGDQGSYSIALIIGILSISFFGFYNSLLSWIAVLILIYPIFELLFTVFRRLLNKRKISEPDNQHIHQLFFKQMCKFYSPSVSNNLVSILLLPIWIFPLVWFFIFGYNLSLFQIFSGIIVFIIGYLLIYFFLKYNLKKT